MDARDWRPRLNPLGVWEVFNDPNLRFCDLPGGAGMASFLMANPDDPALAEAFLEIAERQHALGKTSGDPFWPNYPPIGSLPSVAGQIPIVGLPTGDVLPLCLNSGKLGNALVSGLTGSGKTTLLRLWISALLADWHAGSQATVVVFDRKDGEIIDCESLTAAGLPVYPIRASELLIAALQPPPGIASRAFNAQIVELMAAVLNLFASRRLMSDTLARLSKRERAPSCFPRFSEWMSSIDAIRANSMSRLGQYREAVLYAMQGIYNELGSAIDAARSDFFERLYSTPGCFVIMTGGLSVDVASFLACLFINWIYMARGLENPEGNRPVVFLLDDSLRMIYGSSAAETEGSFNPIASWAFMGRSRGISLICAAQNFAVVSPAFRNNCSTIVSFASHGRDAEELARHLHLDPEQAAVLPIMQPGEAVAVSRSVWPLPVRGVVEELP